MKKIALKYLIVCILAFALYVYPQRTLQINSSKTPLEIEIVGTVSDGSYILRINGRLYRTLDAAALKIVTDTQRERDYFINQFRQCDFDLRRRNEGE